MKIKFIASFSGGHDSTAMILYLIENSIILDEVCFADTTLEFPLMYDHINKCRNFVEKHKIKFTVVYPKQSFNSWFYGKFTKGKNKGRMRGFPLQFGKHCHLKGQFKGNPLSKITARKNIICYLGINYDEKHRKDNSKYDVRKYKFPLLELKWGRTEVLSYLKKRGFENVLYNDFSRTGCWLCPQQSIKALKSLYLFYPNKWRQLKKLELDSPHGFRTDITLKQLEERWNKTE